MKGRKCKLLAQHMKNMECLGGTESDQSSDSATQFIFLMCVEGTQSFEPMSTVSQSVQSCKAAVRNQSQELNPGTLIQEETVLTTRPNAHTNNLLVVAFIRFWIKLFGRGEYSCKIKYYVHFPNIALLNLFIMSSALSICAVLLQWLFQGPGHCYCITGSLPIRTSMAGAASQSVF